MLRFVGDEFISIASPFPSAPFDYEAWVPDFVIFSQGPSLGVTFQIDEPVIGYVHWFVTTPATPQWTVSCTHT